MDDDRPGGADGGQGPPDAASAAGLLTVDELAAATGLTVRTARYYAGLGLLPPPERRGRLAYYSDVHRARLELIRALQEHGFTLAAIEKYFTRLPADAGVAELGVQRAMLTRWSAGANELVDRAGLEERLGQPLDEDLRGRLVQMTAIRDNGDDTYELQPTFDVGVRALALDIPVDSLVLAGEAIGAHMDALADELTVIFRERVIAPYRDAARGSTSAADAARFDERIDQLRQLTLEAVLTGFQRAANEIITRSLREE